MSSLKEILVIPGCGYQESIHRDINSTKQLELLEFI